jgi:hypothetical protein
VYCIVEPGNLEGALESAPEGLESGQKLELVRSAGLGAVVSAVPLSRYGEQVLQANMSDAGWAASRVMSHERVVEYFASRGAVIPLRFGTIYTDRRSVGQMLARRAAELNGLVDRLRRREEWGVSIYCDRARLIENKVSKNASIRSLLDRARPATPGQSYLLAKQIKGLTAKAAREEILAALTRMKEALDDSSEQSISNPRGDAGRSEHGELVARLSFLVQSRRFARFRATAEALAEAYLSSGFHIELVGPLPPYSFVTETNSRVRVR